MQTPAAMLPPPERQQIAAEGARLAATLFRPAGTPRAAVVIHGATGVPAGFYRGFAEWLAAARGMAVLSYDYRDFAASASGPARQSRAGMADWSLRDPTAALAHLAAQFPEAPLWVIGHSLGGLWLHHQPGIGRVARIVTLGSGLTHVTDHPAHYRWRARLFWSAPVAGLARAAGYLPGRALRFGPDLPLQVYLDWRRWCLTRGWVSEGPDDAAFPPRPAQLRAQMRIIAVADDALVPPAAVWRLMGCYPEAVKRQKLLRPGDFGLHRIGHLEAFHRKNAVLWPAIVD